MKYFLVMISLLFVACCHRAPEAPPKTFSAERALSCTLQIKTALGPLGDSYGSGISLLNRPGHHMEILTANHVIPTIGGLSMARFPGGKYFPVVLMRRDLKRDMAILMAPAPARAGCEAQIGARLSRGDSVWSTAYVSTGYEIVHGRIRSLVVDSGRREYLHTSPIVKGWSGGGLWDDRGGLVGMNRAVHAKIVLKVNPIARKLTPTIVYTPGFAWAVHTDEIVAFLAEQRRTK